MEKQAINTIRFLGVDAIDKANSGHPGIVLGAAPMVYTLFTKHLAINSKNSKWINRDRFILSAGHGSALLYAINHLVGYDIKIDDIKKFRNSDVTPGHPEYGHTDGVETTSGPLGQGISNAVGMAIAETHLAKRFNEEAHDLFDHYTYVLCGDGDLQEGVALESISLAGHLGLSKLIVLLDSNDIQLDGPVKNAYNEDHKKKFEAMNWQYIRVNNGNDVEEINKAIKKAKNDKNKPTLIEVKTVIGFGSELAGTSKVHGSPLGVESTKKLRKELDYKNEPFVVSKEVYDLFNQKVIKRGKKENRNWDKLMVSYKEKYPKKWELLNSFLVNNAEVDYQEINVESFGLKEATRNVSGKVLDFLSIKNQNLIGGSADLTSSTKAKGADGNYSKENRAGRNINFGVREHAMAAITNGLVLHGGLKAFCGGFFVFSDYMKPAIRLSAIMNIPSIYVFTHDSIAVGEDGPTHEPIEQLTGLRATPNLNVIRPADAKETMGAWKIALESKTTPTLLILTRQNVVNLENTDILNVSKGGYIVSSEQERLDAILIATGSEVDMAINTQRKLLEEGIDVRVVSMPSTHMFDAQTTEYKNEILPKGIKTIAVEMGSTLSWYKYASSVYGIDRFGVSANLKDALELFGFTNEHFLEYVLKILK